LSQVTTTATSGSSCGTDGTDFVSASGTLTWAPGTTNLTQNIVVGICGDTAFEADETFFIQLDSVENATAPTSICGSINTVVATIANNDVLSIKLPLPSPLGSFDLTPSFDTSVSVNQPLNYAYSWTVPAPENWHDLKFLDLRFRDDAGIALWVRFDEVSQTFSVFDPASAQFGLNRPAGSTNSLQTAWAQLRLSDASVVGSGPTGPSVTLNLPLTFSTQAAGHAYTVEVSASDDQDQESDFTQAGTLIVTPSILITAVERIGQDLRLSFSSAVGNNYALQSRADLFSGTWTPVPNTMQTGTGGTLQQTLTNAFSQPQQLYRIQELITIQN
jgi:hypothetical protein